MLSLTHNCTPPTTTPPPEDCDALLWIHCNVYEYDVYVDGEYRITEKGGSAEEATSTVPDGICGVRLSEGRHTIRLQKSNCEIVTDIVYLECGEEATVRLNMHCEKPVFKIMFIPSGWEGYTENWKQKFKDDCKELLSLFKDASDIEDYFVIDDEYCEEDMGWVDCGIILGEYSILNKANKFIEKNKLPVSDVYVVHCFDKYVCGGGGAYSSLLYKHICITIRGPSNTLSHELGHYFKIGHCKQDCIMLEKPHSTNKSYCQSCKSRLKERFQEIAERKMSSQISCILNHTNGKVFPRECIICHYVER